MKQFSQEKEKQKQKREQEGRTRETSYIQKPVYNAN